MIQAWNVDPEVLKRRSLLSSRLDIDTVVKSAAQARTDPRSMRTKQGRIDWKEACDRVSEYAKDLRNSLCTMGLGIYCANVLHAHAGGAASAAATSQHLEVLQQRLSLASLPPTSRQSVLTTIARGFHALSPNLPNLPDSDAIFGPFDSITVWRDAVERLVTAANAVNIATWDQDAILRTAWQSWHDRLTAHLLGDPVPSLHAANLLVGPTPGMDSLSLPLDDMTVGQWTSVFAAGLSTAGDGAPSTFGRLLGALTTTAKLAEPPAPLQRWLTLAALVRLGFPGAAQLMVKAVHDQPPPASTTDVEAAEQRAFDAMANVLPGNSAPRARRVLVLTTETQGPMRWKPDPENACLVGESRRLARAIDGLARIGRHLVGALSLDTIMLEVPASGSPARARDDARKTFERYTEITGLLDTRCVYLFSTQPEDGQVPQGGWSSTGATSLREAIPRGL
jgi:hypothetical protein